MTHDQEQQYHEREHQRGMMLDKTAFARTLPSEEISAGEYLAKLDKLKTNMKYIAVIAGGIGPDVWDREVEIDAEDFMDAARQAQAKATDANGSVVLLDTNEYPMMTDAKRLDAIERIGIELVPRKGLWNCLIADTPCSQEGVSSSNNLRWAIDSAIQILRTESRTSCELA